MKKPERRLFVSVACAAALMVCGAVMMHLDKKPDEATFFAMDCPCTAAVYGGDAEAVKDRIKAFGQTHSVLPEQFLPLNILMPIVTVRNYAKALTNS